MYEKESTNKYLNIFFFSNKQTNKQASECICIQILLHSKPYYPNIFTFYYHNDFFMENKHDLPDSNSDTVCPPPNSPNP